MIEKCSLPWTQQYFTNKYNWTNDDFNSINWEAIKTAMTFCSFSIRTWVSKLNYVFIGTASMLAHREYWLDDHCPLCRRTRETTVYLVQGPHPPHRQKALLILQELSTWLTTSNCEPTLAAEIVRITTLWITEGSAAGLNSAYPPIQQQIDLGWQHFIFGKITKSITQWQHNYVQIDKLRREAQFWTFRLVQKLWTTLVRPLWRHRNDIVHAQDKKTSTTHLHQDIKEEVRELYLRNDVDLLAAVDRRLFDTPLDD